MVEDSHIPKIKLKKNGWPILPKNLTPPSSLLTEITIFSNLQLQENQNSNSFPHRLPSHSSIFQSKIRCHSNLQRKQPYAKFHLQLKDHKKELQAQEAVLRFV